MEILFMLVVLLGMAYGVFAIVTSFFGVSTASVTGGFAPLKILVKLLGLDGWKKNKGARFLPDRDLKKILNGNNRGLLIDGKNLRLSAEESFTHNMVVAPTGAGKSTRYDVFMANRTT